MLKRLGKYDLLELAGHGAMGDVYKAHDPTINRLVALKTITGSMVGDAELLDRFYQEARSAGVLQHPNIVTVYELGQEGDTPFIAMEYLEGESLEKLIERRPILAISQKVGVIVQVCRALECAHSHGVIHRDIKPGNVMLIRDGTVKVVDFGIARLIDTSKTHTNMLIGTLGYMSPQQFDGERADQRSDIWALGVVFFELLCYRRPFEGANSSSLILSIVDEKKQPPRIREFVKDCPPELEAVIGKMLKKDVNERFQSMEEVLFEIEPLWRNLQEQSVHGLIEESEDLIQAREFGRARDLLRKALQIDRRNDRANSLLERVTAELREIQVRAQVESALARGRSLLKEGRYDDARVEAEAALKLDSACLEARDFVAEVFGAAHRADQVRASLQLARQRLAEGQLTEAATEVGRVLSLDAANMVARGIEKQIQDQQARRAERKRHASVLQRARKSWAGQQLDDCIDQLNEALKEFPNDPEMIKLLETARQDKAEHQRQLKLAEAKSLLAAQLFERASAIVESLSQEHPNDPAVRKLSELLSQQKEELLREQKLQDQAANLHSLVNGGKLSEAISLGEKLMQEFPDEIEFAELVDFARSELAQHEQKRSLVQAIASIRANIEAGTLSVAVLAAEAALARFPRDADLENLLARARQQMKEEKNRELLQKRISEIRRRINRGQLTDAVDLARETLATNGSDTELTQMLSAAEMELAQKRQRQAERDQHTAEARKLVADGQFRAATEILLASIEKRILSTDDPVVRGILSDIREKDTSTSLSHAALPPSLLGKAVADGSPGNDYVFQRYSPFGDDPTRGENLAGAERASIELPAAPATAPLRDGNPAECAEEPVAVASPQAQGFGPKARIVLPLDEVSIEKRDLAIFRFGRFIRAPAFPFAIGALGLAIAVSAAAYLNSTRRATKAAEAEMIQARQLEREGKWPEALAGYKKLSGGQGAIAEASIQNATRLRLLIEREDSIWSGAQTAESNGNLVEAMELYQQLADLHGDRAQQALGAVDRVRTAEQSVENSMAKNRTTAPAETGGRQGSAKPSARVRKPCQLNETDIAKQLDRAESNRAKGDYEAADREFTAVLDCEPRNDRALSGLSKTKAAESFVKPGLQ